MVSNQTLFGDQQTSHAVFTVLCDACIDALGRAVVVHYACIGVRVRGSRLQPCPSILLLPSMVTTGRSAAKTRWSSSYPCHRAYLSMPRVFFCRCAYLCPVSLASLGCLSTRLVAACFGPHFRMQGLPGLHTHGNIPVPVDVGPMAPPARQLALKSQQPSVSERT